MQQVQVITGVERRRRFSDGEKVRILAETQVSGASDCGVARRHGLSPSLLYSWKKAFRDQRSTALALSQKESGFVKLLA